LSPGFEPPGEFLYAIYDDFPSLSVFNLTFEQSFLCFSVFIMLNISLLGRALYSPRGRLDMQASALEKFHLDLGFLQATYPNFVRIMVFPLSFAASLQRCLEFPPIRNFRVLSHLGEPPQSCDRIAIHLLFPTFPLCLYYTPQTAFLSHLRGESLLPPFKTRWASCEPLSVLPANPVLRPTLSHLNSFLFPHFFLSPPQEATDVVHCLSLPTFNFQFSVLFFSLTYLFLHDFLSKTARDCFLFL